eukprot:7382120-Prymnesium_polylepis.3
MQLRDAVSSRPSIDTSPWHAAQVRHDRLQVGLHRAGEADIVRVTRHVDVCELIRHTAWRSSRPRLRAAPR